MDEFDDLVLDDYSFNVEEPTAATQPSQQTFNDTQATTAEEPAKPKKINFNEDLLMDTKGIPLLRNESRYLKFQGKGHEDQDLKKLMTYYTVWANNLYPKLRFRDFARRVGKPASGQRIKVMMNEWQKEHKDKRQIRLDIQNELSGETVGDEDGDRREEDEESSDDDNRPLFFPITESASAAMEKAKKVKKPKSKPPAASKKQYRSSATINSSDEASDDEDTQTTKQPDTITFSDNDDDIPRVSTSRASQKRRAVVDDDEDDEAPSKPVYSKSGREHALAILAERRKQREVAQKKLKQQEEEEEAEEEEEGVEEEDVTESIDKIMNNTKSVDDIMNEYYDDDTQLALSDNELLEIQKTTASATQNIKDTNADNDDAVETTKESDNIVLEKEKEPEFDSIVMEDLGIEKEDSNVMMEDTEIVAKQTDNAVLEEDSEMYDI